MPLLRRASWARASAAATPAPSASSAAAAGPCGPPPCTPRPLSTAAASSATSRELGSTRPTLQPRRGPAWTQTSGPVQVSGCRGGQLRGWGEEGCSVWLGPCPVCPKPLCSEHGHDGELESGRGLGPELNSSPTASKPFLCHARGGCKNGAPLAFNCLVPPYTHTHDFGDCQVTAGKLEREIRWRKNLNWN